MEPYRQLAISYSELDEGVVLYGMVGFYCVYFDGTNSRLVFLLTNCMVQSLGE